MAETVFSVYWDGDYQAEFKTREDAENYVKHDMQGMSTTYNKSLAWIKRQFTWEIVEEVLTDD